MDKFIYVFSEYDRDSLINAGLSLLKSDDKNGVFIFENTNELKFDLSDHSYVLSNTLTF